MTKISTPNFNKIANIYIHVLIKKIAKNMFFFWSNAKNMFNTTFIIT